MNAPDETILDGDKKQLWYLRKEYNRLLDAKEEIVSRLMNLQLTSYQLAEAEVAVALITGEIKHTDAMIHYLMFGGEMMPNELHQPLKWQIENRLRYEIETDLWLLKDENKKLKKKTQPTNTHSTFAEDRLKEELATVRRKVNSLYTQLWAARKELKEIKAGSEHRVVKKGKKGAKKLLTGNIFYSIPGPLTITVPQEEKEIKESILK